MVVYIESAALNNFAVDAVLLSATDKTVKAGTKKARILLGAALGAAVSLLMPLLRCNAVVALLIKAAVGFLISRCGVKTCGIKRSLFSYLLFLGYTFLFGGLLFGVTGLMRTEIPQGFPLYLMTALGYFGVKLIVSAFFAGKKLQSVPALYYEVRLVAKNAALSCRAYLDTGNRLTAPDGSPVFVANHRVGSAFIAPDVLKNMEYLTVHTVSGSSKMPMIPLEKAEIVQNGRKYEIFSPKLVVSEKTPMPLSGCDLLLGAETLFSMNGGK